MNTELDSLLGLESEAASTTTRRHWMALVGWAWCGAAAGVDLRELAGSPDAGPLVVPDTIEEGGLLVIRLGSTADEISLLVPGAGIVHLPVVNGRVEYRLPPTVTGGDRILVSDNRDPPASGSVLVTSNNHLS